MKRVHKIAAIYRKQLLFGKIATDYKAKLDRGKMVPVDADSAKMCFVNSNYSNTSPGGHIYFCTRDGGKSFVAKGDVVGCSYTSGDGSEKSGTKKPLCVEFNGELYEVYISSQGTTEYYVGTKATNARKEKTVIPGVYFIPAKFSSMLVSHVKDNYKLDLSGTNLMSVEVADKYGLYSKESLSLITSSGMSVDSNQVVYNSDGTKATGVSLPDKTMESFVSFGYPEFGIKNFLSGKSEDQVSKYKEQQSAMSSASEKYIYVDNTMSGIKPPSLGR